MKPPCSAEALQFPTWAASTFIGKGCPKAGHRQSWSGKQRADSMFCYMLQQNKSLSWLRPGAVEGTRQFLLVPSISPSHEGLTSKRNWGPYDTGATRAFIISVPTSHHLSPFRNRVFSPLTPSHLPRAHQSSEVRIVKGRKLLTLSWNKTILLDLKDPGRWAHARRPWGPGSPADPRLTVGKGVIEGGDRDGRELAAANSKAESAVTRSCLWAAPVWQGKPDRFETTTTIWMYWFVFHLR